MSALDERRYQVFVSSTFKDLESERQKVLQAVLEMKAFPAGMEMFPSVRIPRDGDQRSELMSITIPRGCRSGFRTDADQFYGCSSEQ